MHTNWTVIPTGERIIFPSSIQSEIRFLMILKFSFAYELHTKALK